MRLPKSIFKLHVVALPQLEDESSKHGSVFYEGKRAIHGMVNFTSFVWQRFL